MTECTTDKTERYVYITHPAVEMAVGIVFTEVNEIDGNYVYPDIE